MDLTKVRPQHIFLVLSTGNICDLEPESGIPVSSMPQFVPKKLNLIHSQDIELIGS